MLGREVSKLLEQRGLEHVESGHDEVDITDLASVVAFARQSEPDWIVNCAAYTNVDRAEEERDAAWLANVEGPRNLARAARMGRAALLHVSTDYVFDGRKEGAYDPGDPTCPIGAYGTTKADGEAAIARETERFLTIRTAWLYGRHGKNFVSTIVRLLQERGTVRVVRDQRGSPTYAADLADAMVTMMDRSSAHTDAGLFGTYHYTNSGGTTWFGFAEEIARQAKLRGIVADAARVEPILAAEFAAKAPRPANSLLSLEKTERTFGIEAPSWQKSLERYLEEIVT